MAKEGIRMLPKPTHLSYSPADFHRPFAALSSTDYGVLLWLLASISLRCGETNKSAWCIMEALFRIEGPDGGGLPLSEAYRMIRELAAAVAKPRNLVSVAQTLSFTLLGLSTVYIIVNL